MAAHPASPRSSVVAGAEFVTLSFQDDGAFPNNARLPVLHYRGAFQFGKSSDPAVVIERVFGMNRWSRPWRDGVYNYHHYHSTAHEALGCYAGRARLQLGGPTGLEVEIELGDVLVLPAGVAHKNLDASKDFCVVGSYAGGRSYDMKYGHADERPEAGERIARVPFPEADPVYGKDGPLMRYWSRERGQGPFEAGQDPLESVIRRRA
jgi:uncharacterized protein YjlB